MEGLPLLAHCLTDYAVPLGLLAVVDTDHPDVEAWVAQYVARLMRE